MNLIEYNVDDGYGEALVRGYKKTFLTYNDYKKLSLSESLEDLRSALEDTVYGDFMQDESTPITIDKYEKKLKSQLHEIFQTIKTSASYTLCNFLDFISKESMIDNIVMLLRYSLFNKNKEKMANALDPIGWDNKLNALLLFEGDFEDLFRLILVEAPIGNYLENYIDSLLKQSPQNLCDLLKNVDFDIMRASLKKLWLEDFYIFVQSLQKQSKYRLTSEIMTDILSKEADYLVLSVTLNSLGSPIKNDVLGRENLYPNFGYFYPSTTDQMRKVYNEQALSNLLVSFPEYYEVYQLCKSYYTKTEDNLSVNLSFEDAYYKQMIITYEEAFMQQMNYAVFYSFFRLKEQEIRNILWIAEMISINQRNKCLDMIVPLFTDDNE